MLSEVTVAIYWFIEGFVLLLLHKVVEGDFTAGFNMTLDNLPRVCKSQENAYLISECDLP